MVRMLGRYMDSGCRHIPRRVDDEPGPDCTGHGRDTRWRKRVERRELARELRPEGLLPTALPADGDCIHGCNGGCVYVGSETCNFTCHDLAPEIEALFERLDRRAMELLGDELVTWERA